MKITREHLVGLELAKKILGGFTSEEAVDAPYLIISDALEQAQDAPVVVMYPDGNFVSQSDYDALAAENDRLLGALILTIKAIE